MISVLMPTRERPELARQSIESLGGSGFEVLIRIDDDDPQRDSYVWPHNGKYAVMDKRVGYSNFHVMVNQLAAKATGEWLMLWNDDAIMHTPDWAQRVQNHHSSSIPCVLNLYSEAMNNNLFPIISRPMYEAMGHFSLSTHCDSWVQDIANSLGIHLYVPGIDIEHKRDLLNDETKQQSQGAYAITSPLYDSDGMKLLRMKDMEKIRRAM